MSLPTEAERSARFREVYARRQDAANLPGGFLFEGFKLRTFDEETGYAQFCSLRPEERIAEYIEFALDPENNTPVMRRRYYARNRSEDGSETGLLLQTASFTYPLGDFTVDLTVGYESQPQKAEKLPQYLILGVSRVAGSTKIVQLAKCRYNVKGEQWPDQIDITASTIQDEIAKQADQLPDERSNHEVANAIGIRRRGLLGTYSVFGPVPQGERVGAPRLGDHLRLGEEFHCGDLGYLAMNIIDETSTVMVLSKVGDRGDLDLVFPEFTPARWDRGVRGNWRNYIDLVKNRPVRFDYTES